MILSLHHRAGTFVHQRENEWQLIIKQPAVSLSADASVTVRKKPRFASTVLAVVKIKSIKQLSRLQVLANVNKLLTCAFFPSSSSNSSVQNGCCASSRCNYRCWPDICSVSLVKTSNLHSDPSLICHSKANNVRDRGVHSLTALRRPAGYVSVGRL